MEVQDQFREKEEDPEVLEELELVIMLEQGFNLVVEEEETGEVMVVYGVEEAVE